MAIQHYIFDIDDTLYLERDYVHSGFDAVGPRCQTSVSAHTVGICFAMASAATRLNSPSKNTPIRKA